VARDFLLEIGTEEIPARFLTPALEQLRELAARGLEEKRLAYRELRTLGTPRRLVLYVGGLAEEQTPLRTRVKGPAKRVAFDEEGRPTAAAEGFARNQGVRVEDLVVETVGQVEYVFAVKEESGRPAAEVLAELAPELIAGLHFPKPMRWGDLDFSFIRPIRWLLALLGPDVVTFRAAGLTSGRITFGHRLLSKGPITVADPDDYFRQMRAAFVLVDPEERRRVIWEQVRAAAASVQGRVPEDEALLEEVTNLVEWPTAFVGSFAEEFLELPAEALMTPMKEQQRYFPVVDAAGKLLPRFIGVSNGNPRYLDTIRAGNESVLRARLADARFFWREDLQVPLADRVDQLRSIVFLEGLGTMRDKVQRLVGLTEYLVGMAGVDREAREHALRAALLSKADLVTNMVYEFPELQGVMGREYALRSGEGEAVARAVFEHYLPRFAGDRLPESTPGRLVALADKLDNLVGCFAAGIQPTGSQDPYALRRQATGLLAIILEAGWRLSLRDLIARAYELYGGAPGLRADLPTTTAEIMEFLRPRLKGLFEERGLSWDTVEAVLAAGYDDAYDAWRRGEALQSFRATEEFPRVYTVLERARNLARHATHSEVRPAHFVDPAEEELYRKFRDVREEVHARLAAGDIVAALRATAALYDPLDRFFNAVLVMTDDVRQRENRLALLQNVAGVVARVADFARIVA